MLERPEQPASYRPIALLSTMLKLFEKMFMVRLVEIVDYKKLIPDHPQYSFRESHSTIEQVHRVGSAIRQALEEKKYVLSRIFYRGQPGV